MILVGIGDEAGAQLESQIAGVRELGWNRLEMRSVQVRGFEKANFHDIPPEAFDQAAEQLEAAGVGVYCFGSAIMNWSKTTETPWEVTVEEVKRCLPRLQRLGTQYVRIMSFKPADDAFKIPRVVFQRVREVVQRFVDGGIVPVHENCM